MCDLGFAILLSVLTENVLIIVVNLLEPSGKVRYKCFN